MCQPHVLLNVSIELLAVSESLPNDLTHGVLVQRLDFYNACFVCWFVRPLTLSVCRGILECQCVSATRPRDLHLPLPGASTSVPLRWTSGFGETLSCRGMGPIGRRQRLLQGMPLGIIGGSQGIARPRLLAPREIAKTRQRAAQAGLALSLATPGRGLVAAAAVRP